MKAFFFCLVFLAASTGVTGQTIRDVDFLNFTYSADYCGGEEGNKPITVTNGQFYKETVDGEIVDRMFYSVEVESYGDLNGDGQNEAVITSICNTGGTGNFSEAYIYTMQSGKPRLLVTLVGGDRAFGGIRNAVVKNGLLIVESSDAGEFGGACCPEYIVTNTYRLNGTRLSEVGKSSRREIYPAKTIRFKRGRYGTTFRVRLSGDTQVKRFLVRAAKGQTLRVSKSSNDADIRLFRGSADVIVEGASLVAKLKNDGDYVFELVNQTERAVSLSVTVTIK